MQLIAINFIQSEMMIDGMTWFYWTRSDFIWSMKGATPKTEFRTPIFEQLEGEEMRDWHEAFQNIHKTETNA